MKLFPDSIEEKLGFDILGKEIESRLISEMGQEEWADESPSSSKKLVEEKLLQVNEMQALLQFDDPFPWQTLPDIRQILKRIEPSDSYISPEALVKVKKVLSTIGSVGTYLGRRSEKYPTLSGLGATLQFYRELEQSIEKTIDDFGQVRDDASPQLAKIRKSLVKTQDKLRESLWNELKKANEQGFATEDQPTIRNGRMVIPVRAEAKRKVKGFIQDVSASGNTAYIEPASCLELNNEIKSLEYEATREIENILKGVASLIRNNNHDLLEQIGFLGKLDLIHAKAQLANQIGGEVPSLNEEGFFEVVKAKNPVLVFLFKSERKKVVPFTLRLGKSFTSLIITGPNAGGKSVTMKAVGLMALMLGFGIPIPVDGAHSSCCLFEKILVDIGDEQSIENDLSTYSSHLNNLKTVLEEANSQSLVLIDEAGTGTDPLEGVAMAQAILEHLVTLDAKSIITTHHGNLKVYAYETPKVENAAMQFDQEKLEPTFELQVGVPGSSYAFEMATRIQIPPSILQRAQLLMGKKQVSFDMLITEFENRNLLLREKLEHATKELEELQKVKQRYQVKREQLIENQEEIRAQALEEAKQILQNANATVERTIREIKEAQASRQETKEARKKLEEFKRTVEIQQAKRPSTPQKAKKTPKEKSIEIPKTIAIGDQVVVNDGMAVAEVLELSGKFATITQGSMKMKVKISQLRRVGGKKKQEVKVRKPIGTNMQESSVFLDIRGKRVEEAFGVVTKFVDNGVSANATQLEILHGTGTGALRNAIRDWLKRHPHVTKIEDAPWDSGGPGVSYIFLK